MYYQRPDKTAALVLSGTGYNPTKEFAKRRIDAYTANGIDYRWAYTFEDLSPAFRATPLAHFFANLVHGFLCHNQGCFLREGLRRCEFDKAVGSDTPFERDHFWFVGQRLL